MAPLTESRVRRQRLKVLLAVKCSLLREGIEFAINRTDDLELVASVTNWSTALVMASSQPVDVIVIGSVAASGASPRRIKRSLRVRIVTMASSPQDHSWGFCSCSLEDLLNAIRGIPAARHDTLFEGSIGLSSLTAREREVFHLAVSGLRNKEIASRLDISVRTVETHRARIFEKLKVRNVADLARFAAFHGLLA